MGSKHSNRIALLRARVYFGRWMQIRNKVPPLRALRSWSGIRLARTDRREVSVDIAHEFGFEIFDFCDSKELHASFDLAAEDVDDPPNAIFTPSPVTIKECTSESDTLGA